MYEYFLEREREIAQVLDEKSIPASKIEVSWAMGDSVPYSVPTWFLAPWQHLKQGLTPPPLLTT